MCSLIIIIEFAGFLILVSCIIFFFCFPVCRDRFLFGNKSWFGSLIFSCALVTGLILSISLTNQIGAEHRHYVDPYQLVNWNAAAQERPGSTFNEDNFYAIVSQFADPGNIPSSHGEARKFALILAMLGIFCLSGLVMSSFVTLLTKRSDKWKQGLIRYNNLFFRNYVVIIGVNEQTATIAKQALARKGVRYVLIQTRQNVESAREKAAGFLEKTLSQQKKQTPDQKRLIREWFARNPLVDVEEGFFIQGTETPKTAEGTAYPENWIDKHAGEDETPHHVVKISKMKVCSVPVTQELWNIVMKQDSKTNPARIIGHDYPQTNICYREIKEEFLPELNSLARVSNLFNAILDKELTAIVKKKGRIPKDIDDILSGFEPYKKYSGSDNAADVAWFGQNCLQPVGRKKPFSKEFRVFDMSGNVWEWVDDFYQTDFYNYCIGKTRGGKNVDNKFAREYRDKGYVSNPICENPEYSAHVFRGGSWILNKFESRCTRPNYWEESYKNDDLGFRIVLAPKRK